MTGRDHPPAYCACGRRIPAFSRAGDCGQCQPQDSGSGGAGVVPATGAGANGGDES